MTLLSNMNLLSNTNEAQDEQSMKLIIEIIYWASNIAEPMFSVPWNLDALQTWMFGSEKDLFIHPGGT